jgi:pimeloyl-ACP methyl ester carboxylesterase
MTLGPDADRFDNISLDRPGYGLSTPLPNRTIADFVPDALVLVLHGGRDTGVPVDNAYLTARLIPGADLRIFPDHGHFSIAAEVLPALAELTAI